MLQSYMGYIVHHHEVFFVTDLQTILSVYGHDEELLQYITQRIVRKALEVSTKSCVRVKTCVE